MRIKNIIKTCLGIVSITILASCQWETIEPIVVDVPDVVSFSADIQPILDNKCNSCHKSGGMAASVLLTNPDAYNTIISNGLANTTNPPASLLLIPPTDNFSHNNHMTDAEKAFVLAWVEQGALDN